MRSQLLLLPTLLAVASASNIHNLPNHLPHNLHPRQNDDEPPMTIQTDTTANNGFLTTITTTNSIGDPSTLTWQTVPSVTTITSGEATVTVTTATSTATETETESVGTSSLTAGGARVTGVMGMGALGLGAMVVGGLVL